LKLKVGIIGGTFDPVHLGHLICADFVRNNKKLDKIIFLPAAVPPHKTDKKISQNKYRLAMLRLALKDNPYFEISEYEIRKGGISYTIDTIQHLKQNSSDDVEYFLIIGADNLLDLENWKKPDTLLREVQVLVLRRPGIDLTAAEQGFIQRVTFIDSPVIEISSSDIRRRIKEHTLIKYLVPKNVEKYIYKKGMYT